MGSSRSPLVGRALLALTCRMRGSDILGTLKRLEPAPFRSRDEIRDRQFRDVLALLAARRKAGSVLSERSFGNLGIHSQDIRDWDDFARVPILTKDIIREEERALIREDVPIEKLQRHFSGGSTGVPLKFFRSREYMVNSDAGTYRKLEQCGWRPGEMIAFSGAAVTSSTRCQAWNSGCGSLSAACTSSTVFCG